MEATRKKYRSLRSFSYATNIIVREKNIVVTFDGGNRSTKTNGFFVTDNEEIQKALEALPQYNKDFYLEETFKYRKVDKIDVPPTITTEIDVPVSPQEQEQTTEDKDVPADSEEGETPESGEQTKEDTVSVPGVTNCQAAKLHLLGMFPNDEETKTKLAELKKADEVRQFAKEKGVVFPDWI